MYWSYCGHHHMWREVSTSQVGYYTVARKKQEFNRPKRTIQKVAEREQGGRDKRVWKRGARAGKQGADEQIGVLGWYFYPRSAVEATEGRCWKGAGGAPCWSLEARSATCWGGSKDTPFRHGWIGGCDRVVLQRFCKSIDYYQYGCCTVVQSTVVHYCITWPHKGTWYCTVCNDVWCCI